MLNIVLFFLLGIFTGIATGLIPGLHPNTIAVIILSITPLLLGFGTIPLLVFLVALGITNSIVDFIPSIILGAPEASNSLSVLPGHKLLLQGKGFLAIYLTVKGGFYSIIIAALLLPLLITTFPLIYEILKPSMAFILVIISISLITLSKRKTLAILFFFLSSILGIITMNAPLDNNYTLFPLLTGLFGFSIILNQLRNHPKIPKQRFDFPKTHVKKNAFLGTIGGFITGILPGVTPSQIASFLNKKGKDFLTIIGAITTANIFVSFLAIKLINHPRSGIAVVLNQIMDIGFNEMLIMILVSIIAVCIAAFSTIKISKFTLQRIHNWNYQLLNYGVLIFLNIAIFRATGLYGLLIAWAGGLLGLSSLLYKVRRYNLMASLITPTILFYLGIEINSLL